MMRRAECGLIEVVLVHDGNSDCLCTSIHVCGVLLVFVLVDHLAIIINLDEIIFKY